MVILLLYKHHFSVNCSSLLTVEIKRACEERCIMGKRNSFPGSSQHSKPIWRLVSISTEETRLFYSIQRLFICWKVFRNHLNKCMEVSGFLNLTEMICEKDSHVGTL